MEVLTFQYYDQSFAEIVFVKFSVALINVMFTAQSEF